MKKVTLFLMCVVVFFSCNKDDDNKQKEIVSKWKLIEVLADPGDGSGNYQPVESGVTIEFYEDGTVSSNSSLCYMGTEANEPSTGTYSLTELIITPNNCDYSLNISFEQNDSLLLISYPCIEPCGVKYKKE